MKKPLILTIFLGIIHILNAQIPNGFSYQAVVRNSEQTLLKNQIVTIKATILRNDEALFEQTQTATTNENGLLTIIIGNESFQDIDWLQGTLFIKTEIDPAGGSNFTIETQTQLLTVPFAMAAKTAETAVTMPGLDTLIERVNNLEGQVEELYLHLGIPFEVRFTECSLDGTLCEWKKIWDYGDDLHYDGELYIINCNDDLANFIICPQWSYPNIDFTEKTILNIWGISWSNFEGINLLLFKNNAKSYSLKTISSISEAAAKIKELTGIERKKTQVRKFLKSMGFRCLQVGVVPAKAMTEKKKEQKEYLDKELQPRLEEAKRGECTVYFANAVN